MRPTQIRDFKMNKVLRKFWLLLAFGLTTTVFFSCEKNDENGNGNNPFVGTWEYDGGSEIGIITGNADMTFHGHSIDRVFFYDGTYSYSEKDKTLKAVFTDGTPSITFNYVFVSDDSVVLTYKENNLTILFTRQKNS